MWCDDCPEAFANLSVDKIEAHVFFLFFIEFEGEAPSLSKSTEICVVILIKRLVFSFRIAVAKDG